MKTLSGIYIAMVLALAGCVGKINFDAAYVENKAYRISERVTTKMLTDNPTNAEMRKKFTIALADLKVLKGKTNTTMVEVIAIVQNIPKVSGSKKDFWVETGVLIFEDELGTIGIRNPALALPAVAGLERGVEEGLEKTKQPPQ